MNELKDNQLLVTISEDGHTTSIRVGKLPEVKYSSCPDKPYENIENSIKEYMNRFRGQSELKMWESKGCWFKGTGKCNSCN